MKTKTKKCLNKNTKNFIMPLMAVRREFCGVCKQCKNCYLNRDDRRGAKKILLHLDEYIAKKSVAIKKNV